MSGLKRLFCDHPASVNESYLEHLAFAVTFGVRMIAGGLACIIHGVLPFLFVRTGSRSVCDLHETLKSSGRPTSHGIEAEQVAHN